MSEWIPTSERLPEDNQTIIVTWINENPEPYIDLTPHTSIAMRCGGWYWWYPDLEDDLDEDCDRADNYYISPYINITAWQSLPKPYKEEHDV